MNEYNIHVCDEVFIDHQHISHWIKATVLNAVSTAAQLF